MARVDVFALEADDSERLDRQNDYDDLATLLDDYVTAGGTVRGLLNAVEQLVETQEQKE